MIQKLLHTPSQKRENSNGCETKIMMIMMLIKSYSVKKKESEK